MSWFFDTIKDLSTGRDHIRARRYGVIEVVGAKLVAVHLRPWPKLISLPEILPLGPRYHAAGAPDRCLLYYNQPWRMPNFLALKYIVSTTGTSYATLRAALSVLDHIAELKRTDAIVCDAGNIRLSDRLLARFGWEPHKPQRWHRNYIRRFYGVYPVEGVTLCHKAATGGRGEGAKPPAEIAPLAGAALVASTEGPNALVAPATT
jgi:hypothetical protein